MFEREQIGLARSSDKIIFTIKLKKYNRNYIIPVNTQVTYNNAQIKYPDHKSEQRKTSSCERLGTEATAVAEVGFGNS